MDTNMGRLKGLIVERNTTQTAVSAAIGIDKSTFFRKMNSGGLTFTIGEVHKLADAIPLTKDEAIEIFLHQ